MSSRLKRYAPIPRWYEATDRAPAANSRGALALPKGYYQIVRRRRSEYATAELALADIRACFPRQIIGEPRHMDLFYCWQVQTRPLPTQVK